MMFVMIINDILVSEMFLAIQCVSFILLNVLDGFSTWLVLRPHHYEREKNPVARWVFRKLKLPFAILFFKAFILSLLGIFFAYWWHESLTLNIGLLVGNLLYSLVVLNNFRVHRMYERVEKQLQKFVKYTVISQ